LLQGYFNSTLWHSHQEDQGCILSKHFILKQEQQEEMQFQKRQTGQVIKRATFLPIIPLVRQVIPSTDKDKAAFITFELKVCAGTGTGTPSYKKFMKTFEEGLPQAKSGWMC
jgi:hypothetical protein